MPYGNVHRYLLREMLFKSVMTERDARKLILDYPEEVNIELAEMVQEINRKILPFSQEIKNVKDEIKGESHLVMTWTGLGEAALSQTLYSNAEVLYFKKLLEEIASRSGKLNGIQAMNFAEGITKTRAQELTKEWISAHYLTMCDSGEYILGLRAIHEFEPYLRQHFPEIVNTCILCNKSVFQSTQCTNCNKHFHNFCLEIALKSMNKWPCCRVLYERISSASSSNIPVEDESDEEANPETSVRHSTSSSDMSL